MLDCSHLIKSPSLHFDLMVFTCSSVDSGVAVNSLHGSELDVASQANMVLQTDPVLHSVQALEQKIIAITVIIAEKIITVDY